MALLERSHNLGVLPGDGSLIGSPSLSSTGTSGAWGRISGGLFAELYVEPFCQVGRPQPSFVLVQRKDVRVGGAISSIFS